MGLNKLPQFPLRIRTDVLEKMRYIGYENSRSTNKEIEQACLKYIKQYEENYGEIELEDIQKLKDNL